MNQMLNDSRPIQKGYEEFGAYPHETLGIFMAELFHCMQTRMMYYLQRLHRIPGV